jgi:hypothetical protein
MTKRALIVGINDYPDSANDLPSCVNDATNFQKFLQKTSPGFKDVKYLLNSAATVNAVEDGLKWLFANAKSDDQLVFFYSGHGYTSAKTGIFQEYLCLYDDMFQDDRLSAMTQNLPDGILTCVFDSCFSGGMDKIPVIIEDDGKPCQIIDGIHVPVKVWQTSREIEERELEAKKNAIGYKGFGCKVIRTPIAEKKKDFQVAVQSDESRDVQMKGILVSASQEGETAAASSASTNGMSAFTYCFLDALLKAGKDKALGEVVKDATTRLVALGFRQTPCVKYPAAPAGLEARPFLSISVASGADSDKGDTTQNETVDSGLVVAIVLAALRLNGGVKGFGVPSTSIDWVNEMNDKNWADDLAKIVPVIIQVADALSKNPQSANKWGISGGGGFSIPGAGAQIGGSVSDKNWADDLAKIVPVVIQVVGALSKSPQVSDKNWADDLAKIVPIVIQVAAVLA